MGARPSTIAGLCGMALVAVLYVTNSLLMVGGGILNPAWLLVLTLPGALAGQLSWTRGTPHVAMREGMRAGLLMAHFASALQVLVLALGVLNVDWARYASQVGPRAAEGVRGAALPAALVTGVIIVGVTYAGCVLAGWLGARIYHLMRRSGGRLER
jgi:hypothetical protein